nr:MAG TPA: hypothetical protein [Caudoviricetes sp.]
MSTTRIFSLKRRLQNNQKGGDSPRHSHAHKRRFLPELACA